MKARGSLRREVLGSLAASSAFHPRFAPRERREVRAGAFALCKREVPEGPQLRGRAGGGRRGTAVAKQVAGLERGAQRAVFAWDFRRRCATPGRGGLASFFGLGPFR